MFVGQCRIRRCFTRSVKATVGHSAHSRTTSLPSQAFAHLKLRRARLTTRGLAIRPVVGTTCDDVLALSHLEKSAQRDRSGPWKYHTYTSAHWQFRCREPGNPPWVSSARFAPRADAVQSLHPPESLFGRKPFREINPDQKSFSTKPLRPATVRSGAKTIGHFEHICGR